MNRMGKEKENHDYLALACNITYLSPCCRQIFKLSGISGEQYGRPQE